MIRLKYAAAIVLIICFFLPLSRCATTKRIHSKSPAAVTQSGEKTPTSVTSADDLDKQAEPAPKAKRPGTSPNLKVHHYFIPAQMLEWQDLDFCWRVLSIFFWPLPFFFLQNRFSGRKWPRRVLLVGELALACWTGWFLHCFVYSMETLPAGYAALIAGGILVAFPVLSVLSSMRFWTAKRFKNRQALFQQD
ncbi:hypothetical protein SAMN02745216_05254 [Desulfatibacillum alkenivorans DSM 16219]|jgi:hypothetical protein|uniref:Uncharacterized protein n=1 Tax=Desulfatibacillum alkenivorans DSM 16219 TaxID=1121393 RepID=A0A1M7B044_9BACT|nr:hypothetical protein [Desulfatibacillum alkenivorans]SHL48256.1 hypothetical protein SAMN02745216_05254 [Desulfatibacillum alkenivorans DSM 16219]